MMPNLGIGKIALMLVRCKTVSRVDQSGRDSRQHEILSHSIHFGHREIADWCEVVEHPGRQLGFLMMLFEGCKAFKHRLEPVTMNKERGVTVVQRDLL